MSQTYITDKEAPAARVLYIDDDHMLCRLVQKSLTELGYVVELAADSKTALNILQNGYIDVVSLDHHLVGETGLDVLPAIRALPDAPPIIYVTGSEDSRVAVAALKGGAVDYVWKDVQGQFRELLGEAVATAIQQKELRRAKERAEIALREALDRAEMLLREVNHRVANSLALVAALAHMQTGAVSDLAAKAALQEMQTRISAIAGIHRRLYTSNNVEAIALETYMASLIEDLQAAMRTDGREHKLLLYVDSLQISTDKAISIGMAVTELVTNAYKYAYPSNICGDVRVFIKKVHGKNWIIKVEDDGIGWNGTGHPQGTGLGSRIVRAMAKNLQTDLNYSMNAKGTQAVISFCI